MAEPLVALTSHMSQAAQNCVHAFWQCLSLSLKQPSLQAQNAQMHFVLKAARKDKDPAYIETESLAGSKVRQY